MDLVDAVLQAPISGSGTTPGAEAAVRAAGIDQSRLLLHHFAAEHNRALFEPWEIVQMILGLGVAGMVYLAVERRPLPLIFCGLMLALVLVQYFAITPELTYRGRQIDFPAPVAPAENAARVPLSDGGVGTLNLLFSATEAAKLIAGAILASYLFYYRSRKRRRSNEEEAAEIAKAAALRGGQGSL